MSTPMFSIGGLGSGLDTAGIVTQLMQIERQPVYRFQQRQADLRAVDAAWSSVIAKMGGLRTAADALRQPSRLAEQVAVTSSSDTVGATRTGTPAPGSVTFSVERLATAHQIVAGTAPFAAADAVVGEGSFVLRGADDAPLATIATTGTTTLTQLATQINRDQRDVAAQVVRTGDGAFRLVLTARETGEARRFTIDTDLANLGGTPEGTTDGLDAHLKVGTLDVFRSTNRVTDLIPGVQLDLKSTSTSPTTVTVDRDVAGMVTQVKGFVEALNGALATLKEVSATGTAKRGPLAGDSLVRGIATELRMAMTAAVDGLSGGITSGSAIGIAVQRDGTFKLDEARLKEVLADDVDAVGRLFARVGTAADGRMAFAGASEKTQAGDHAVVVTAAARVASATGAVWSPPVGNPKTFSITMTNGKKVDVVVDVDDGIGSAVAKINAALRAEGIAAVKASEEAGALTLTGTQFGASMGFTVSGTDDPGLDGVHRGADVQGTINGVAATGSGQMLTAGSGTAEGLRVRVTASGADVAAAGGTLDLGAMSLTQGLAGKADAILRTAVSPGGSIARAREGVDAQIRRFDERILAFEDRLTIREKSLRARFTAMERVMGQFQMQASWMSAQISSLSVGQGS